MWKIISLAQLTGNRLKLQYISLQQFHSLIISFCLSTINPPTPESTLFVVKERIEGLKYNIDFGGRGWGYTGGGDRYVHYAKRDHFIEVSQHFCPSLYLKS